MRSPGHSLIVGATGFLGRNLRAWLDRHGWEYGVIERGDGDLRDRDTVMRLFAAQPPVERIFHVATFQRTGPRQYEIPAELLDNNTRMHLNVLDGWVRHQPQAKLISTGSSCAYPEHPDPIPESLFQGGRLHDSVRAYGLAKHVLAVGSEVQATQHGLKWLHCVFATMFGPHDHLEPDRSHFIGGMMARAIREQREGRKQFSMWGAPDTVRECLYVDDQIEAMLAADAAFENTIVNCASNDPVIIDDVARGILDALGWRAEIVYLEGTFQGAARKVLDSSRFLEKTGWRPRVGLGEGLRLLARDLLGRC